MGDEEQGSRTTSLWGAATDWSLIERAGGRRGSGCRNEAWRQLLERYRTPIEVALRKRLPPELSDQGTEDFFTYLFEHQLVARAQREKGRFRCYVQGIMRRWVYHYLRSERHERSLHVVRPDPEEADPVPEAVLEEDRAWASAVLMRAVRQLAGTRPQDRDLLVRAYGLDGSEPTSRSRLAAEYDLRVGTLNVRLHAARKHLQSFIEKELRLLCRDAESWKTEREWMIRCLLDAHPTWRTEGEAEQGR